MIQYIIFSERLKDTLVPSASGHWIVIRFFFDFRAGHGLRNSLEGFVRSLLLQLCHELPALAMKMHERFGMTPSESSERPIDRGTLAVMLEFAVKNAGQHVLLFLDGLDEYQDDKADLIETIKTRMVATNTKICLSCRPDPPFAAALQGIPSLAMHKVNKNAIHSYCLEYLEQTLGPSDKRSENLQYWAEEIATKAEGVMLWAIFAVREVFTSTHLFEGKGHLMRRLEQIPNELNEIYMRKLSNQTESDKHEAGFFLALVGSAEQTLSLLQLYQAARLMQIIDAEYMLGLVNRQKL